MLLRTRRKSRVGGAKRKSGSSSGRIPLGRTLPSIWQDPKSRSLTHPRGRGWVRDDNVVEGCEGGVGFGMTVRPRMVQQGAGFGITPKSAVAQGRRYNNPERFAHQLGGLIRLHPPLPQLPLLRLASRNQAELRRSGKTGRLEPALTSIRSLAGARWTRRRCAPARGLLVRVCLRRTSVRSK